MWLQALLFSIGIGLLYFGAEWLVRGAASLALRYGIRPLVVGLTVVALGTSMPEFVINFLAVLRNEDSLALGNIVGSNIANIALILGTTALVLPIGIAPNTLRKEYPVMMGVMVLFYGLSWDGVIGTADGIILVFLLVSLLIFLVLDARRSGGPDGSLGELDEIDAESNLAWRKKVVFLGGGMIMLASGARLMVSSAVNVAESYGVSTAVIGLTVMALGTSLPELAASLVSAVNDESAISLGNVLGSNMLNMLFVVGLVSLVHPLQVDTLSLSTHLPVMLGFGALLFPLAWTGYRITRMEGFVMLIAFLGYMAYLIQPHL
ncbi:MAG: sodium:proton exchanger [Bacteroidetes bacterium QS_8_64_10]|nr:MAG: sodium:proton exchanger [Bacteroidetes bacterium QS_8_64_10]